MSLQHNPVDYGSGWDAGWDAGHRFGAQRLRMLEQKLITQQQRFRARIVRMEKQQDKELHDHEAYWLSRLRALTERFINLEMVETLGLEVSP